MKRVQRLILLIVCLLALADASAKKLVTVPKMYMFGMAAAFTDTIVHFTSVQAIDSAWIDSKTKFLQSRDSYSAQLRNYLSNKEQMPQRTCIVVYATNEKKLQKKYETMKRLYIQPKKGARQYDVRSIADADFHFTTIDETPYLEQEEPQADNEAKKPKEKKKKRGK
jgi:hypothetical protein